MIQKLGIGWSVGYFSDKLLGSVELWAEVGTVDYHWYDSTPHAIVVLPPPSSPADKARAFAEPILAAISDRPPDYADDFSDPGSGWDVRAEQGIEIGYADGEYFALNTPDDAKGTCSAGWSSVLTDLSDFVLDIDGRFVSGQDGLWYIELRAWGDEATWGLYEIMVDPRGLVHFGRQGPTAHGQPGAGLELIAVEAPFLGQGYETNHFQLVARGPQFALRINGEWAGFATDPHYTQRFASGGTGLKVCRQGDSPLRVQWDNLKIWDISDRSCLA